MSKLSENLRKYAEENGLDKVHPDLMSEKVYCRDCKFRDNQTLPLEWQLCLKYKNTLLSAVSAYNKNLFNNCPDFKPNLWARVKGLFTK